MNDPIKHVVVLILENHSFDQMLGSLKAVYPNLDGVDVKNPASNEDGSGNRIFQKECRESQMLHDPCHEHVDVEEQLADGNSGFVRNFLRHYSGAELKEQEAIMGYYPLDFLPALHPLARSFRICDRWFSSLPGPTWPNRMFALSGTSMGAVKMPQGIHDLAMTDNQTQDTIFDRLSDAKRNWKIYYYDFPSSLLLVHQRQPECSKNYSKIDDFFRAAGGSEEAFPEFALIEPKYYGLDQNDDHPPHNVMKAEKLIADVYNAIRTNEELWQTTLLAVFYDEHGGFYDHVPPPPALAPDDHHQEYDFTQYGVRVPALLISPWLPAGVENTQLDHTSLLKYLTQKWNLQPLTKRVEAANSVIQGPWLDQMRPNTDTPAFIRVPYSSLVPSHPEWELGDTSVHQNALEALASKLINKGEASFGERLELFGLRIWSWIGTGLLGVGHRMAKHASDKRAARLEQAVRKYVP